MTKSNKMKWTKVQQNDDEGSSDSLTDAQLAEIYGAGARILSTYHRPKPTIMQSTTSSTSSVATNAGSTAALIKLSNSKKNKNIATHKNRQYTVPKTFYPKNTTKMTLGTRKELNLLLASPTVPDMILSDSDDAYKRSSDSDECIPTLNSSVIMIKDSKKGIRRKAILKQVLASLTVSLGSMIVGFASAYTSPALPSMRKLGANGTSNVMPTPEEASWIGSLMPLSALFGGMAGGPLIESLGRRTTILSTAPPFIISFLMIAFAQGVPIILVGRSIAGFCVGIASLALPVYLGETVQPEVRGTLGLLPTFLGNIGILSCFTAGAFLNWWQLALMGACIPIPFLICMFFIPETPRWYLGRNKHKDARKALQWLRGQDADISREFAEIEKMNDEGNADDDGATGCSEVFKAMYARPLLISIGLMFFQQMSGINAVIFYTVQIFQDAGSKIDENLSTVIVGVVNLLSTLIATAFIDRLGRKILLYISSTAMTLTLFTLGSFFYYKHLGYDVSQLGWLPLVTFVIYVIGFSIGFGSIPWLMMGEILPAKIRGSAASLATAFNWTCTFIVTKTFNDLTQALGKHGAFWLFCVVCAFGLVFVILFVPETQGKSLEDIERNLTGCAPKGEDGKRVRIPVRNVRRMSSIANLKPLPMGV